MSESTRSARVVSGRSDALEAIECLTELSTNHPGSKAGSALALVTTLVRSGLWNTPRCSQDPQHGTDEQRDYAMAIVFQPDTCFAGLVIVGRGEDGEPVGRAWAYGDDESIVRKGYEALGHAALLSEDGRHVFNEDLPDGF